MAIDGTLVMNPFLYSKLAYDPFKDFAPVSLLALVPSALVGNVNIPVNSIIEMVEQEKAKPGSFQIGISTPTSQVNVGLLNMMAGTSFGMVPYRGGTTQITGILAGDIPLGMESINVSLPLWRDKKVKILGLVSAQRLSLAPEIPTIAETFPGYDLGIWQSIVAPAGTSPARKETAWFDPQGAGDGGCTRKARRGRNRACDEQDAGGVRCFHPLPSGNARQSNQSGGDADRLKRINDEGPSAVMENSTDPEDEVSHADDNSSWTDGFVWLRSVDRYWRRVRRPRPH